MPDHYGRPAQDRSAQTTTSAAAAGRWSMDCSILDALRDRADGCSSMNPGFTAGSISAIILLRPDGPLFRRLKRMEKAHDREGFEFYRKIITLVPLASTFMVRRAIPWRRAGPIGPLNAFQAMGCGCRIGSNRNRPDIRLLRLRLFIIENTDQECGRGFGFGIRVPTPTSGRRRHRRFSQCPAAISTS